MGTAVKKFLAKKSENGDGVSILLELEGGQKMDLELTHKTSLGLIEIIMKALNSKKPLH